MWKWWMFNLTVFQLVDVKLAQQPVYYKGGQLIPPWSIAEELHPGTFVNIKAKLKSGRWSGEYKESSLTTLMIQASSVGWCTWKGERDTIRFGASHLLVCLNDIYIATCLGMFDNPTFWIFTGGSLQTLNSDGRAAHEWCWEMYTIFVWEGYHNDLVLFMFRVLPKPFLWLYFLEMDVWEHQCNGEESTYTETKCMVEISNFVQTPGLIKI